MTATENVLTGIVINFDMFRSELIKTNAPFTDEIGKWYSRLEKEVDELRKQINLKELGEK